MTDATVADTEAPESVEVETEATQAAEEQSEDKAEATEEQTPSESSTEKEKDGIQKRIDELTKKFRDAEREAEYWRQQAETAPPEAPDLTPDKGLADFDYDEKAYSQYLIGLATDAAKRETETAIQRETAARRQAEFYSKEREFAESVDDYDRVTRNPSLRITDAMVETLQASDEGPAVLYYLGKNPEVADRLAGLPPIVMAREIGRIEASELAKPGPSTSKAPPPTPKLDATEAANRILPTEGSSDKLSMDEWVKRRRKQIEGK